MGIPSSALQRQPNPVNLESQPHVVERAQKLLGELAKTVGIQISGGLGSDCSIPLNEVFVNLTLISTEDLKKDFDAQLSSSTGAERRRQVERFSSRVDHAARSSTGSSGAEGASDAGRAVSLESLFTEAVSERETTDGFIDLTIAPSATPSGGGVGMTRGCSEVRNVLAYGAAGSGKTTVFLLMVVYLWSHGRLWNDVFDFILGLELRENEVRTAQSLGDLLAMQFTSLGMSKAEVVESLEYFQRTPNRLCIVLDGLDECEFDSCSKFMRDLLLRKAMVGVHVIVTSRPCTDAYQLSQCGQYHLQLEVQGFSPRDLKTYVCKVLGQERGQALLAHLESKPDIASLMSTPMFAALACELSKSRRSKVWTCSTCLYEAMLLRIVERAGGAACGSLSDAQTKAVQHLCELGRFAFCMLILRRVVFSSSDLTSSQLSAGAVGLGLLQTFQGALSTDARQYRFRHLSLQEFLAAWYVRKCVTVHDRQECIALVQRLPKYDGHMAMFWSFLIALCPSDMSSGLLEAIWCVVCQKPARLLARQSSTIHGDIVALAEETLGNSSILSNESDMTNVSDRLCEVMEFSDMVRLADILLAPKTMGRGRGENRVRRRMSASREFTDHLFLQTLLLDWMATTQIATGAVLYELMKEANPELAERCKPVLQPGVALTSTASPSAADGEMATLAYATKHQRGEREDMVLRRRMFIHLVAAYKEHSVYHGVSCNGHCSFLHTVLASELALDWVPLSAHECMAIGAVLRNHRCIKLEEVHLWQCSIGDLALQTLSSGLMKCVHVRILDLASNGIHDGVLLSSVIMAMSASLEDVDVTSNPIGCDDFTVLCKALSQCTNLQVVTAGNMYLAGYASLKAVSELLEGCKMLSRLSIWDNMLQQSDAGEQRFVQAVKCHTMLHRLYANGCDFSEALQAQLREVQMDSRHSLKELHALPN
eukprot:scpid27464/ scgid10040/ NACHT, LRR and PYD domains-containing protein 3; Cold autoinflammatory syndrome 1 protein homolog; Cryopyrin; Mast cell maturation-associated-inducible protein 1; PYRIN-containing APAF1-like protein 1